jgi:hypothetical protein
MSTFSVTNGYYRTGRLHAKLISALLRLSTTCHAVASGEGGSTLNHQLSSSRISFFSADGRIRRGELLTSNFLRLLLFSAPHAET